MFWIKQLKLAMARLKKEKYDFNFLEIKKLKNTGWTIGCHTATHPNLAKLDKTMLKKEIILSLIHI